MKIGIITQPLRFNYGGILQNYALQTVLKRMGHEPVTLRVGKDPVWRWCLSTLKNIVLRLLKRNAYFREFPIVTKYRTEGMERFIRKHITATHPQYGYEAHMLNKLSPGALIVGSDQVWRPIYNRSVEDMFLNFAKGFDIIKVTYAASFGTDKWEFSPAQASECRELLKSFRAVSVREQSGVKLCKKYLDRDAEWVLDPTLLLTSETYNTLCRDIIPTEQPFVFAYLLDVTEDKLRIAATLAEKTGLPLRIVSTNSTAHRNETPEKWLAAFRDSAYVVTDSFHGTIFSIIYHRKFITINNSSRGSTRFDNLLSITGLEERLIEDKSTAFPQGDIDWQSVDERLEVATEKSLRFLKNSLS